MDENTPTATILVVELIKRRHLIKPRFVALH